MIIIGFATITGLGVMWAFARCPLGRAVALSVDRFAAAAQSEPGALD